MAGATTIAVLFALSFMIVRVAAVAMRLTGLPENVARFQCISALTGAGFTTSESEMIVNYPLRRRILVVLMIVGNLGLASVAATFIVSFAGTEPRAGAIAWQAAMIALAVGVIVLVMINRTLDRAMCELIATILTRTTRLGTRLYHRTLQVDSGLSVAEHMYRGVDDTTIKDLPLLQHSLVLLTVRAEQDQGNEQAAEISSISPGDILVCYGSDGAHESFARALPQAGPASR
jgi:hypothetical protein